MIGCLIRIQHNKLAVIYNNPSRLLSFTLLNFSYLLKVSCLEIKPPDVTKLVQILEQQHGDRNNSRSTEQDQYPSSHPWSHFRFCFIQSFKKTTLWGLHNKVFIRHGVKTDCSIQYEFLKGKRSVYLVNFLSFDNSCTHSA